MSRLQTVSGSRCAQALERVGFVVRRKHGSHIVLRREAPYCQVVVQETLDKGALRAIIKAADMTVEQFVALL
ncbi:MAG: type II toxin-antitoxin system HicA family toxin [Armatimonadetes bacterium]|nr:type II toxin-antitoxin system HicA family toxin [Armatimonadota bacterium]